MIIENPYTIEVVFTVLIFSKPLFKVYKFYYFIHKNPGLNQIGQNLFNYLLYFLNLLLLKRTVHINALIEQGIGKK